MGKIFLNSIQYAGCAQGAGFSLSDTLTAGATTLTFTDARIKATSMVFPWCSIWGVLPESVTVSAGSIVIVFPVQSADMEVGIAIDSDAFEINHEQVYSSSEHIVGKWIDGSDVYEKTVDVAQYNVTASSSAWNNLFEVTSIDMVISAEVHKESPNVGQFLMFRANNGYVQVASNTSVNLTSFTTLPVTFRYTKSST